MWHVRGERERERGVYSDLMGKSVGKRHLEDLAVKGRIILKLVFQ
jgi:hypothetical protein